MTVGGGRYVNVKEDWYYRAKTSCTVSRARRSRQAGRSMGAAPTGPTASLARPASQSARGLCGTITPCAVRKSPPPTAGRPGANRGRIRSEQDLMQREPIPPVPLGPLAGAARRGCGPGGAGSRHGCADNPMRREKGLVRPPKGRTRHHQRATAAMERLRRGPPAAAVTFGRARPERATCQSSARRGSRPALPAPDPAPR